MPRYPGVSSIAAAVARPGYHPPGPENEMAHRLEAAALSWQAEVRRHCPHDEAYEPQPEPEGGT